MVEWGDVSGLHRDLDTVMDNIPRLSFCFLFHIFFFFSLTLSMLYSPEYHMFSS